MSVSADHTTENKSPTLPNAFIHESTENSQGMHAADYRPVAVSQRKLQEAADNSSQVKMQSAYQLMADQSPQVQQLARLQKTAGSQATQKTSLLSAPNNHTAPIQGRWYNGAARLTNADADYAEKYIALTDGVAFTNARAELINIRDNGGGFGTPLDSARSFLKKTYDSPRNHTMTSLVNTLKTILTVGQPKQIGNSCYPTAAVIAELDRTSEVDTAALRSMIANMSATFTTGGSAAINPSSVPGSGAGISKLDKVKELAGKPLDAEAGINYLIVYNAYMIGDDPISHTFVLRSFTVAEETETNITLTVQAIDPNEPNVIKTETMLSKISAGGMLEKITIHPQTRPADDKKIGVADSNRVLEVINLMHAVRNLATQWRTENDKKAQKDQGILDRLRDKMDGVGDPLKTRLQTLKALNNADLNLITVSIYNKLKEARRAMGTWAGTWVADNKLD